MNSATPARPRPQRSDGEQSRERLLHAALALFAEHGFAKTSTREIAEAAGTNLAAISYYFGDKAGLLTAVATEGFERFIVHLAGALPTDPADYVENLPAIGRAYAEFAALHPGQFDVMFRPTMLHASDPAYLEASTAAFEGLRQHIERCQQAGWRRDADTLALTTAAWSLAHGLAVLRNQGSLGIHFPGATLDGVEAIVATLTDG